MTLIGYLTPVGLHLFSFQINRVHLCKSWSQGKSKWRWGRREELGGCQDMGTKEDWGEGHS